MVKNSGGKTVEVPVAVTSILYPDGTPIRIKILKNLDQSNYITLSDEGRTITYVLATARSLDNPESLDRYIALSKQPEITRDGAVLTTRSSSDSTTLQTDINLFASACRNLAVLGGVIADIDKLQQTKARAERDERESKSFRFKSRNEVVAFQQLLEGYVSDRIGFRFNQISLVDAYDFLVNRTDRERIVAAVLDLVIGYCALSLDYAAAEQTSRSFFSEGRIRKGSIFDSPALFGARMDIHRLNSSFVLRYRALWDKIMGIYVLLLLPASYEKFTAAKSRKEKFKRLIENERPLFAGLANSIVKLITDFDKQFRTPEAHGAGVLRKWTLIIEPSEDSPQNELGLYWAKMRTLLTGLGDVFRGPEKTILRELSEMWVPYERKEMPDDLRSLMRSVVSAIERIVPKYVRSEYLKLSRIRVHTIGLLAGIYASWLYQNPDREMEKRDVEEIENAIAELPESQPELLGLIHQLADYWPRKPDQKPVQ